jgi:hypothetical protein
MAHYFHDTERNPFMFQRIHFMRDQKRALQSAAEIYETF